MQNIPSWMLGIVLNTSLHNLLLFIIYYSYCQFLISFTFRLFVKKFNFSRAFLSVSKTYAEVDSKPTEISKMELKAVHYFREKLYLRCLTVLWIRLCYKSGKFTGRSKYSKIRNFCVWNFHKLFESTHLSAMLHFI